MASFKSLQAACQGNSILGLHSMAAAERLLYDNEDTISCSTFSNGPPLVDDERYVHMVDPACSECDDGGKSQAACESFLLLPCT